MSETRVHHLGNRIYCLHDRGDSLLSCAHTLTLKSVRGSH